MLPWLLLLEGVVVVVVVFVVVLQGRGRGRGRGWPAVSMVVAG